MHICWFPVPCLIDWVMKRSARWSLPLHSPWQEFLNKRKGPLLKPCRALEKKVWTKRLKPCWSLPLEYKNKKTSQNRMIIRDLARLGAELAEGSFAVATECFWAVLGGRQKTERLHNNGLRSSIRKNSNGYQILAPNLAGPWEGSFDGEEMQLLRSCHNGGHTCRSVKEIRF